MEEIIKLQLAHVDKLMDAMHEAQDDIINSGKAEQVSQLLAEVINGLSDVLEEVAVDDGFDPQNN
jgi:hypothetical protein